MESHNHSPSEGTQQIEEDQNKRLIFIFPREGGFKQNIHNSYLIHHDTNIYEIYLSQLVYVSHNASDKKPFIFLLRSFFPFSSKSFPFCSDCLNSNTSTKRRLFFSRLFRMPTTITDKSWHALIFSRLEIILMTPEDAYFYCHNFSSSLEQYLNQKIKWKASLWPR